MGAWGYTGVMEVRDDVRNVFLLADRGDKTLHSLYCSTRTDTWVKVEVLIQLVYCNKSKKIQALKCPMNDISTDCRIVSMCLTFWSLLDSFHLFTFLFVVMVLFHRYPFVLSCLLRCFCLVASCFVVFSWFSMWFSFPSVCPVWWTLMDPPVNCLLLCSNQ